MLAVTLIALSVLGVLAAPWLVYLLASGFARTPGKVELTAELIRIMFPYILFVSLVSLAGGVLNTYRRFAIPAFTPVLLNLAIIGAAIFLAPHFDPPIVALAWGVAIGGVAQLALQIRPLMKLGMLPRPAARLARRGRAPGAEGDGSGGARRVGGADLGAHQHAARGVSRRRPHLLDHLRRPPDGISQRAARRRAGDDPAAQPLAPLSRRESGAVSRAPRLGPASRRPAVAAGGAGARRALGAADRDALPVRTLHRQRRMADARRAARLQRRPARPDRGEDSRARLLRAAGHAHAGALRVHDAARLADARGHADVSDRPRRADAGDLGRSAAQRRAALSCHAAREHLHAASRVGVVPRPRRAGASSCLGLVLWWAGGSSEFWISAGLWAKVGRLALVIAAGAVAYFGALWLLGFRFAALQPARAVLSRVVPAGGLAVRALRLQALGVEIERVLADLEAALAGDLGLALLDLRVEEFLDAAALQAHQVIVVPALVELEHRLAGLEVMAHQQARLLELRQHAVDRREPDVEAVGEQLLVDVLGGQMPDLALLEQVDDPQPRQRGLEPGVLEIVRGGHGIPDAMI